MNKQHMVTLDFSNVIALGSRHGLTNKQLSATSKQLRPYLESIQAKDLGFYSVIDDSDLLREIRSYARKVKGQFDHIVVSGIGGSSLGTICLQQSLTHLFGQPKKDVPTMHVLDNIDPILIQEVLDVINIKKTLFIVVSKSGTTPEILSQFLFFKKRLQDHELPTSKYMVFVTDPEKGFLRDVADEEGVTTFAIPPNVGGRFSVQTAVGLLPAALIGINTNQFLAGMQDMRDVFLSTSFTKNMPFQLAAIQYLLGKKGKQINVLMPYSQKLIRLADWYRQLLAESIGKAKDNNGKTVNVGLTPVNALGATDQHSQSQLYNEGPNDKLIMFIRVEKLAKQTRIPALYPKDERTAFLKGVTFNQLIDTELQATADSYTKNKRPNLTMSIEKVDAYHLGQLMMLFEGATAFLGEFYQINAFNQPGVELAKKLTKQYLQK